MRWLVKIPDSDSVGRLSRDLNIPPLLARLLVLRGIEDPVAADRFLHPSLSHLHDPCLMADMNVAVARLRRAINAQEKILIYGDYDVDGTMAVVVLLTALRSLGAKVEAHIPHRLTDGYGMRVPVIERAAADGYRVVLSVDSGIREHAVVARASELAIDCIVTDHHLPESRLPAACAILNPHRADCRYPDKNLSGVGVAFKLVQALLGPMSERSIRSYLKVVAVGTIADVVPLVGENRVIAHFGLAGLKEPNQSGLRALLEVSGMTGDAVTAGAVGFRLAPRLNAAGRMQDARDVIDLFTVTEPARAREIAEQLDDLNRARQQVEERMLVEITEQMTGQPDRADRYSLVFSGEGWHRGVIGIVAQRVVERWHRPTLVIGVEDGVGVGSGRSITGFHLLDALSQCGDLFQRHGGHAQAAGFTIPAERIPELETRFERWARETLTPADLEPILRVDGEVSLLEVNRTFYEGLRNLWPHGMGNPTPVFATRALRLLAPPQVFKEKHLKLRVGQGVKFRDAWGWGLAERATALVGGQELDLAFTLDEDVYQDFALLRLIIRDLQVSGDRG